MQLEREMRWLRRRLLLAVPRRMGAEGAMWVVEGDVLPPEIALPLQGGQGRLRKCLIRPLP